MFFRYKRGNRKNFVIRAIQLILKVRSHRVIPVLTSAVASSLLEEGRTAHSLFKIPIPCYADSVCNISMESNTANELRHASLIIWDEVVTCVHYCIAAVDRSLRVIMKSPNVPFGAKCVLFSGDFRQILPVVRRGSRSMIVFMCFKSSTLYESTKCLKLTQNMILRAIQNSVNTDKSVSEYPDFFVEIWRRKVEKNKQ